MRRTAEGARAMLDLRSVWIAGRWETFQRHRVGRDGKRHYPRRDLVAGEAFLTLAPWRASGYAPRGGSSGRRRPCFSRGGRPARALAGLVAAAPGRRPISGERLGVGGPGHADVDHAATRPAV